MNTHASGLPPSPAAPSLILSSHDLARLEALLESPALARLPAAAALAGELERATVVPPGQLPPDVVAMHSQVDCEDELGGEHHRLILVYPHEADVARGRISVLAPVGAALLGLRQGQSIDWRTADGRALRLRVSAVRRPTEAAGDAHR
ncbi:nucleoside diphosphate kinase regulator [Xanthomonas massiliensis]|uniref:nucleoside diphosphate kinase regulator n=1 Tax=Xanthomonas massiliensis TaxID=1720302 RepID=UPI00082627CD|nr:nucleoside diphosphate kinase regulator [Xanthomonas massiliensis]